MLWIFQQQALPIPKIKIVTFHFFTITPMHHLSIFPHGRSSGLFLEHYPMRAPHVFPSINRVSKAPLIPEASVGFAGGEVAVVVDGVVGLRSGFVAEPPWQYTHASLSEKVSFLGFWFDLIWFESMYRVMAPNKKDKERVISFTRLRKMARHYLVLASTNNHISLCDCFVFLSLSHFSLFLFSRIRKKVRTVEAWQFEVTTTELFSGEYALLKFSEICFTLILWVSEPYCSSYVLIPSFHFFKHNALFDVYIPFCGVWFEFLIYWKLMILYYIYFDIKKIFTLGGFWGLRGLMKVWWSWELLVEFSLIVFWYCSDSSWLILLDLVSS